MAQIPKGIYKPLKLYCCDRSKFEKEYGDSLHKDYLDLLFLYSDSRPDIAEGLVVDLMGGVPSQTRRGYDGFCNETPIEVKISTAKFNFGNLTRKQSLNSIPINDISETIINRYDTDKPLFYFAYYVDGHLVVVFEVAWKLLRPYYLEGLNKKGRKSIMLGVTKWIDQSKVAFCNKNLSESKYSSTVVKNLPKHIQNKILT